MVISRSIGLSISLTGGTLVRGVIQQLQSEAIKLQQTLGNITVGFNNSVKNTLKLNPNDTSLGTQFLSHNLTKAVNDIQSPKIQVDVVPTFTNFNKQLQSQLQSTRTLNIKLSGDSTVKTKLINLENEADKLAGKLNFNINVNQDAKLTNVSNNLNSAIVNPLNNVVNTISNSKTRLQNEINQINNIKFTGITRLNNLNPSTQSTNIELGTGHLNPYQTIINSDLTKQRLDYSLKVQQENSQFIKDISRFAQSDIETQKNIRLSRVLKLSQNDQSIQEFTKNLSKYATEVNNVQSITKLPDVKPTFDNLNSGLNSVTNSVDTATISVNGLIQTGFGLHIIQMYMAPVLYGLEQISAKIVSTFTEFDKLYKSYQVKSEEFGEWLTKSNFYQSSIGQTFDIEDDAIAAERFAASSVDVAKNQQALISVMQVATVANEDYAKAANSVIKTMQSMHMNVSQTTEITDALINSANATTAELSDLTQWFEYSASSAYQMGVNVQNLSAYLGILSNTGTPNTGAAMRQLFLQLSKEDIQKNLKGKFSWITDTELTDFDTLISKMRDHVKASGDEKAATLEITRLLGGKANAQLALQNLLTAEPELWNRVTNAVTKTGSTQELYNKITDNAADSLKKISVNLNILFTQMGEALGPILKVVSIVFTAFTNMLVALPSPFKTALGLIILVGTALFAVTLVLVGVVGALAIMTSTAEMLETREISLIEITHAWSTTIRKLTTEIYNIIFAGNALGTTLGRITTSATTSATAVDALSNRHMVLNSVMMGVSSAILGYMGTSALMQKQMYSEAYVVGTLTSLWLGYSAAKVAAMYNPILAIPAFMGAATAYEALVYDQIETMKNNEFNAALNKQAGIGHTTVNNSKKIDVNIANANISNDGLNIEDLADLADVDYDE